MEHEESEKGNLSTLISTAKGYIDTRVDLFRLNLAKNATDNFSSLITSLVAIVLFLIALLFLSIGAALWLGTYFERMEYGFFAIGGLYVFTGIIFFMLKKVLIKDPISESLMKKMLK